MKPSHAYLFALPVLLVTLCVACQPLSDQNRTPSAGSSKKSLPSINAVLHWEVILADKNQAQQDYDVRIKICENAGIATSPLSATDVARLDTGIVEIMVDSDRRAVRQTMWTLGADKNDASIAGSCRFRLVEEVYEGEADRDGAFEPVETTSPNAYAEWTYLGDDSVGGQPCKRWRKALDAGFPEEICVWSAGLQWGFLDGPVGVAGCTVTSPIGYVNSIPLQGRPLKGGGCILKVRSFSVGKNPLPASSQAGTGGRP